jgi:hypothetical protein
LIRYQIGLLGQLHGGIRHGICCCEQHDIGGTCVLWPSKLAMVGAL